MTALMKTTFLPLAEQIWNQGNSGACVFLSTQTPFELLSFSLKDREYWEKGAFGLQNVWARMHVHALQSC